MRDSSPAIIAALQAAPRKGIIARQLVWVEAKRLSDGSAGTFGFWNGRLPASLQVLVGNDVEVRDFEADGALMSVDKITLTSDISVRKASCTLSLLHPTVRTLWGEYRLKVARVEIYRVPLDPTTRLPVAPATRRFLGLVDTAPVKMAQAGQEGGLTLNCVSANVGLTFINPDKRSDETLRKQRSGDRHSRYTDVVGSWDILFGENS